MKRIIVIGCPGSGKSTFSRALHELTEIPLFHLDMLYWNADRTTVDRAVFRERLSDVLRGETWILDGNYASTMERRMQECDTVFFLDYPPEVCLDGVRARRGSARTDMPWIEAEDEEDAAFIEMIEHWPEEGRPAVQKLLHQYSDKTVYIFRSRAEAGRFLQEEKQKNLLKNGEASIIM